jgi:argonaute-like protein implicated in RNA metabolism and viral defense
MSSNCEISGECDPELILLENEKIRVLAQENFKIVCILRHPVDRFFSHVKMIIPDKNKNPNQIIKTILANDVKELQHQVNHSCYQVLIHKWKSIYDSSNLLFVDDKNLRNKKKKTMEKILSFISDEAFSRLDDDQLVDDKNVGSKWVLDGDLREALNRFFEKDIDSYQSEINNISYP